jgi:hypothetical protein
MENGNGNGNGNATNTKCTTNVTKSIPELMYLLPPDLYNKIKDIVLKNPPEALSICKNALINKKYNMRALRFLNESSIKEKLKIIKENYGIRKIYEISGADRSLILKLSKIDSYLTDEYFDNEDNALNSVNSLKSLNLLNSDYNKIKKNDEYIKGNANANANANANVEIKNNIEELKKFNDKFSYHELYVLGQINVLINYIGDIANFNSKLNEIINYNFLPVSANANANGNANANVSTIVSKIKESSDFEDKYNDITFNDYIKYLLSITIFEKILGGI